METNALTTDMMMVMGMIGLAVFLFIVEWIRVDMVAILMVITLPLLKLVTPNEAFVGFSSNAVISIIAVIIIGAGLDKTGLINRLVAPVIKVAGSNPSRIILAMGSTVAFISSFMQNIGAAALFLPAVRRVSRAMGIPLSQMLMPIGFCCILGGTLTLVGSSPLILLNDLIIPYKLTPFHLFEVTPVGIALTAGGIAFFMFFGRFVLPKVESDADSARVPAGSPAEARLGDPVEVSTPPDFTDFRDPLTVKDIRNTYEVNVVALAGRDDVRHFSLAPETQIRSESDLVVYGHPENIKRLAKEHGIEVKSQLIVFKNEMSPSMSGTIEAVVAPRSELIGKTLRQAYFWEQFRVNPLAIYRSDKIYASGLSDIELRAGDALLLHGTWERFKILEERHNFIFTTPVGEVMKPDKALIAGFWLILALTMIFMDIRLSIALLTGAFGMIVCNVITIDEAYEAVDWRTVFLLAGLIPLGIATEKSGTAAWIARTVLESVGTVSPVVLLSIIAVLSTFFTLVISNVGATVLLVPLVVNMAMAAGADPRMAALVVGIATSNSFILPTHQVNALYMGPGRYRSIDYIRSGGIMSLLFILILIATLYFAYGISAA
jgi:di/tricarboxylate transporter